MVELMQKRIMLNKMDIYNTKYITNPIKSNENIPVTKLPEIETDEKLFQSNFWKTHKPHLVKGFELCDSSKE